MTFLTIIFATMIQLSMPAELIDLATHPDSPSANSALAAQRIVALSTMGTVIELTAVEMRMTKSSRAKRHLSKTQLKQMTTQIIRKSTLNQIQNFLQQFAHSDEVIQEMALRNFLRSALRETLPFENAESMALKALYQGEVTRSIADLYEAASQIKRQVIEAKKSNASDSLKIRILLEQIETSEQTAQIR